MYTHCMGVHQLLNATFEGGGVLLYLQNLPLKQVGYDLHVHVDTLFI